MLYMHLPTFTNKILVFYFMCIRRKIHIGREVTDTMLRRRDWNAIVDQRVINLYKPV